MSTVRAINLVLPEIEVYLASSNTDGQLVLNLRSTLVNPVEKVELVGRGFLRWLEEDDPELDYNTTACCLTFRYLPGVHTFDFHFCLPPSIPSTFTSKIGCISCFLQGTCCSRQIVLAKEMCIFSSVQASVVVEARKDVVYFCCFSHGAVILQISLEKGIFCPGETIVLMTDIHHYLEDQSEVTRLEFQTDTAPFEAMRVTAVLVLPKPRPVTRPLMENKIMAFRYELVGASDLSCTTSTIMGRVPIIIAATSEHFSAEQNTMTLYEMRCHLKGGESSQRHF
uniref:Arrestin domain containing 5 n=1 Tax=Athene cunicularia TaxID=194338 RepID=A0A663MW56_ATHCN